MSGPSSCLPFQDRAPQNEINCINLFHIFIYVTETRVR